MPEAENVKTVLVTGAAGFLGKNLLEGLSRYKGLTVRPFDVQDDNSVLKDALRSADVVYHLAGVNRPETEAEFQTGNVGLTRDIVDYLEHLGRRPLVVFSSSIQAASDVPYGQSKRAAEDLLIGYSRRTGAAVRIYRFPNIFGKWSRPNYNTVVATFCHNIARGLDIVVSDPAREMELVYVDDVVTELLRALDQPSPANRHWYSVDRVFRVTLGELAERICALRDARATRVVPDMTDPLTRCLAATYTSLLPPDDLARPVEVKSDERGWLFELIKSDHAGQIFVSTTHKGVTRGNHYHNTKVEKFCVIQGEGLIRFRDLATDQICEYPVSDREIKVVDIPPGYTHSITNVGASEMIVLFWASEIFDPQQPDTYSRQVGNQA